MRVLWLCNVVLPDFSEEFGLKKTVVGGWMTGMLAALEDEPGIEIALAFPIIDEWRMADGVAYGHPYYSFGNENRDRYELRIKRQDRFREIIHAYNPDIIHLWGTEFPWALEMVELCEEEGDIDRVFVHIQGLVSNCTKHYLSGIPEEDTEIAGEDGKTLKDDKIIFEKRGENEIQILKKVKYVGTRTYWDKACCYAINPDCTLFTSREVLREEFYRYIGSWKYQNVECHTIFVSQAGYPIKGFHYLLEALRIVKDVFPDLRVYVGGEDVIHAKPLSAYGRYLVKLIGKYHLTGNIIFCGKLNTNEIINKYMNCQLFVSSSVAENSSNSVAEAMLIGIPVVASYVGGLTSYLKNGENAFAYPENETDMLAYHIIQCFNNRELCEKLSNDGVETAKEIVSVQNGKNDLISVYEEILNHIYGE